MVDVRKVFVLVTHGELAVLCPGENLDRIGSMVRISWIDGMRVLRGFVAVEVSVVAGCDHEHAEERDGEGNHRC
jgi:hypothetical protein